MYNVNRLYQPIWALNMFVTVKCTNINTVGTMEGHIMT